MGLTKKQRNLLLNYQAYRSQPPTFLSMIGQNLRRWMLLVGALALILLLNRQLGSWGSADVFLGGMVLGVLIRDVAASWYFARYWPVLEKTIDWQNIDEMLNAQPVGPG